MNGNFLRLLLLIVFLPLGAGALAWDTVEELPGNSLFQNSAVWKNQLGNSFSFRELRGRPTVISMFYSRCTSSCPLTIENVQRLSRFLEQHGKKDTNFVLVSFDSENDTPESLARFAKKHEIDKPRWHFLHGSADDVEELAVLLGIKFRRNDDGSYAHSNVLTLLNADGVPVLRHDGLQLSEDLLKEFLVHAQKKY